MSFDETWTYRQARRRGKRREVWIWTAVAEEADGRRWVDFEVGGRSEATFLRLYERQSERYYSDAYPVYQSWLPPGRHAVGKGGAVNRNEGLHSVWRGRLNRLMRRTKGYTKRVEMLAYSLAPGLLAHWLKFNISIY